MYSLGWSRLVEWSGVKFWSDKGVSLFCRDVKSCQIRHPKVRIRYPDTSGRSHRIYETMVYVRTYCSIYAIFVRITARPPQLHRNETFCKLIFLLTYHRRFYLKSVIFTARKLTAYCIHVESVKVQATCQ